MMLRTRPKRKGSVLVESAFVYPVLFLLMFGIVLMGLAVFRYQQVSHMAQEGARYASVHGLRYAQETGNPPATPADVFNFGMKQHAGGMELSSVTYSVVWDQNNSQSSSTLVNGTLVTRENHVTVTVTYTWNTGFFGTIPVSRSARSKMHF